MILVLPIRHPHLTGSQFIAMRKYMTWYWSYQSDITIYKVHNLLQRGNIWHDIGLTSQTPPFTRFTIYCNEKIYDMILVLPVRHHHLPGSQFIAERKYMTWYWSYRSDTPIYQVHNLLQWENIWHDIGLTSQTSPFTRFTIYCREEIYDMILVLPVKHPHLPSSQFIAMRKYDMILVLPVRHPHLPGSQFIAMRKYDMILVLPVRHPHLAGSQFTAERRYMTWHWSNRSDTPIYQVHNLLQWENIWHDIGLTGQTPPFTRFTIYCREKIYDMTLVLPVRHPHLPGSQFTAEGKYMTWYWSYQSDTPIYQVHNLLQWENIWHDIGLVVNNWRSG